MCQVGAQDITADISSLLEAHPKAVRAARNAPITLTIRSYYTTTEVSLTAVFTGPPLDIGFRENTGSAAPVQLLLGAVSKPKRLLFIFWFAAQDEVHVLRCDNR
jgi:hypothetical protein